MNLYIRAHGFELTPALRAYVKNKFERVGRHFDQAVDVHINLRIVVLRGKKREFSTQVRYHLKSKPIIVSRSSEKLYAAIDEVMGALDNQVVSYKNSVQQHFEPGRKRFEAHAS